MGSKDITTINSRMESRLCEVGQHMDGMASPQPHPISQTPQRMEKISASLLIRNLLSSGGESAKPTRRLVRCHDTSHHHGRKSSSKDRPHSSKAERESHLVQIWSRWSCNHQPRNVRRVRLFNTRPPRLRASMGDHPTNPGLLHTRHHPHSIQPPESTGVR